MRNIKTVTATFVFTFGTSDIHNALAMIPNAIFLTNAGGGWSATELSEILNRNTVQMVDKVMQVRHTAKN